MKVVEISRGGTITGRGIRYCVAAVNAAMPSVPEEPPAPRAPLPEAAVSQGPLLDDYRTEVRRKFEQLLASHHERELASYIETLYRDLVFRRP